ncbi:hypothetical protein [Halostella pelagica]|nr:hypothetical protein [Halostella pelagica]
MPNAFDEFNHPAWMAALGTGVGYAIILVAMTAILFGLPYLLFVSL